MLSLVKQLAVRVSASKSFEPILRQLEHRGRRHSQLRVLAYHRIAEIREDDPYYPGLISASPKAFEEQIRAVAKRYSVCSMTDVVAAAESRSSLPPDSVLLTFDDATVDFASHAWPFLQSLEIPATVFVPTAFPDQHNRHFWWDRLYRAVMLAPEGRLVEISDRRQIRLDSVTKRRRFLREVKEDLKGMPHAEFETTMRHITESAGVPCPSHNNVLSWDELRRLAAEGVTLAPHTHTHPMLNQLSQDEIARELRTSCEVLQREISEVSQTLAYPAGGVNEQVVGTVRQEGFKLAFTTRRGVNDQCFDDPFRLRRINVGAATNPGLLRLQLADWGR